MPLGVTAADSVTNTFISGYNSVFPSASTATKIGGLSENNTELNVLSSLNQNVTENDYSFNFESGSAIKLAFTNQTNTSDLRVQLLDITGNVVADSDGTSDQQAAYAQLTSSDGLQKGTGQYIVKVSYDTGSDTTLNQSYNFQLYSGTTYNNAITTSAQLQPYDPKLFESAASSVNVGSGTQSYLQSASLGTTNSSTNPINIGDLIQNTSELSATSTYKTSDTPQYYSFNFKQGNNLKIALNNTTAFATAGALRLQVYDSFGRVIADNYGTTDQQTAYKTLASGSGLVAANGTYVVKVSGSPSQPPFIDQTYNLSIYSGTSYTSGYQTQVATTRGSNTGAEGTNLNVYEASNAQINTATAYNQINATASTGVEIGWLYENKTALSVYSQLTTDDSSEYYNFTFQKGDALKFDFSNSTNTSPVRVQLLDPTGLHVFADNYGTDEQKKAFADLTSSTGYATNNGNYAIAISYPPGLSRSNAQTYTFNVYSGTSYTEKDKTTASAQTYGNAALSGTLFSSYSPASTLAAYETNEQNGTATDIFGNALITNQTF